MSIGYISGRRKIFAEKVAEGCSATEAYLLAGYRPVKRETAHRAASRLYAKAEIRSYIQELRRVGDERAREETTLTIAQKLAFLARLVLTGSPSLSENDPLIQSHRILKDGSHSIRMPCKLKALKMHSELAGHFPPKPVEQPTPTDPLQELVDQIRKMAGEATGVPIASQVATATETRNSANPDEPPPQCGPTGPHWPLASEAASTTTTPVPRANAKNSAAPLPTTTFTVAFSESEKTRPNEPPLHPLPPTPLRPVDIRRMVLAEIQKTSTHLLEKPNTSSVTPPRAIS